MSMMPESLVPWVKSAPRGWTVKKLKYTVRLINEKMNPIECDLPYMGLENVESWTGRRTETQAEPQTAEGLSNRFRANDVLFGKLRPYLAKAYRAQEDGLCTGEMLVLRPNTLDPRFLTYLLLTRDFISAVDGSTYGSKMPRANWEFIGNQPIGYPLLTEQRLIADFLDRETACIDELYVAKGRVLANVEDRVRCVINEAVCRGVNSSTTKTSTGIPWFGDSPSHWELLQLRRVIAKFVDYRGRTPEKVPDGIPLVTAVNIKGARIDFSLGMEFMPESDYESWMVRGLPDSGDVLVTTEAPLGEVAQIEDTRVALAQRIILLKANKQRVTNEYLKYFFLSAAGQGELWTRASGSTAIGIKASKFKGLTIVVPPINEQREIVRHLDCEMEKLHRLRSVVTTSLGKLTEYRSALISARSEEHTSELQSLRH